MHVFRILSFEFVVFVCLNFRLWKCPSVWNANVASIAHLSEPSLHCILYNHHLAIWIVSCSVKCMQCDKSVSAFHVMIFFSVVKRKCGLRKLIWHKPAHIWLRPMTCTKITNHRKKQQHSIPWTKRNYFGICR